MSSYCDICGFPRGAQAPCAACNNAADARSPVQDAIDHDALRGPSPEDYPELQGAFAALANGDHQRMIGQCLQHAGLDNVVITRKRSTTYWAFMYDSAAVYISVNTQAQRLTIESPVVEIPETKRVALLRVLLKLTESALGVARFGLRDNLVVLQYSQSLRSLSPPAFVAVVREVSVLADRYDDILALAFDTIRVGPQASRSRLATDFLGTPCPLPLLSERIHSHGRQGSAAPAQPPTSGARAPSLSPVVGGHATASQSKRSERVTQLAGLEVVRAEARALLKVGHATQFSGTPTLPRVLLYRAFVYYLWGRFGAEHPALIGRLLEGVGAESLDTLPQPRRGLLGRPHPLDGPHLMLTASVPRELHALVEAILHADEQPAPVQLGRFGGVSEARQHLSTIQRTLDEHTIPDTMSHYILLGALHEFLLRTVVPDVLAGSIRKKLGSIAGQQPGNATRAQLQGLLREVGA